MLAASLGQEACVQALLRAGANIELLDEEDFTALQWAEAKGHTATAKLLRPHASVVPLDWPWVTRLSVLVLCSTCAIATVYFSRTQWVVYSVMLGAIAMMLASA